ncbi:MAG TPA: ABC transporter substrate-binding protein [Capillimicrobium sp.]
MTERRPGPRLLAAALAASALAVLAACGGQPAAPASDAAAGPAVALANCDRETRVDAPPQRAVAISQPAIELLLTLGLAERMVGAAGFNDPVLPSLRAENAKVPQLGQQYPSFERVLATEPDFVYTTFAYGFSDEGTAPRERFERLGVATYLSPSECGGEDAEQTDRLTFDDVFAEVGEIARIFDVRQRGRELVASLRRRLATATGGLDADGVSLAWWYAGTKAPYIAGCCGAPGMITERLGATNAFDDSRQLWPETSWEAILERDPDVLVLADLTRGGDGDSAEAKIRFLETDPVARHLSAVRHRRYVTVTASDMDPSLRNVDAVEKVATGLRRAQLPRSRP